MAKIVRCVEDVSKLTSKDFIIEIENIEFIGDDGVTKSFDVDSIVPISTNRCEELDNTVDWNKNNFHFLVISK